MKEVNSKQKNQVKMLILNIFRIKTPFKTYSPYYDLTLDLIWKRPGIVP